MEGGDLRRALSNSDATEALAWHKAGKGIALDIARGLTALHAVNVVHRDLKSKNVLLTSELDAKIGDVGIAAVQTQAGYLTASAGQVVGTLAWSAPSCFWANVALRRSIFTVSVSFCGKLLPATSLKEDSHTPRRLQFVALSN